LSAALGDILRKAREKKGLSIEQLSSITRLNSEFIEALEEGRWDRLPGQVYLRPFVKTCAEALDVNIKVVYSAIDGEELEKMEETPRFSFEEDHRKRFDYKLPLVIIVGMIIIGLIYFTVEYQKKEEFGSGKLKVVPADIEPRKKEIVWNRPWEKPALWENEHPGFQRLRLEATDSVWASVLLENDTLFAGFFDVGENRTFYSSNGFILNLGRNDCIKGYLNGRQVPVVGTTAKGLYNYHLNSVPEGD
jgi:transcriptional regulator with XRE-family HTH domain